MLNLSLRGLRSESRNNNDRLFPLQCPPPERRAEFNRRPLQRTKSGSTCTWFWAWRPEWCCVWACWWAASWCSGTGHGATPSSRRPPSGTTRCPTVSRTTSARWTQTSTWRRRCRCRCQCRPWSTRGRPWAASPRSSDTRTCTRTLCAGTPTRTCPGVWTRASATITTGDQIARARGQLQWTLPHPLLVRASVLIASRDNLVHTPINQTKEISSRRSTRMFCAERTNNSRGN